jgi:hypothetical protein
MVIAQMVKRNTRGSSEQATSVRTKDGLYLTEASSYF